MVYLIHFERALHHARHYLGYCGPGRLDDRMDAHRHGQGARLLAARNRAEIAYEVARVWAHGDRAFERALKRRGYAPRIRPLCAAPAKGKTKA